MRKNKEESKKSKTMKKALCVTGGIALTAATAAAMPAIIKKVGTKSYKKSLENEEIDFDNLGPEIVRKSEVN